MCGPDTLRGNVQVHPAKADIVLPTWLLRLVRSDLR